ncbi:MAG: 5-formyltetrahydrofolate cyclo-ligase [Planctomycetota bacterium]
MLDSSEAKVAVRDESQARLAAMSATERGEASEALCTNLLASRLMVDAKVVGLFAPLSDEPALHRLATTLHRRGVQIGAPRVDWNAETMEMWRIESFEIDDERGLIDEGGLVPQATERLGRLEPDRLDAIIVPGVAFDTSGRRLGRGRGFYDRFLPRCKRAEQIGVCFEAQIVPEIPTEDHDAPVDAVVTEARVIRP